MKETEIHKSFIDWSHQQGMQFQISSPNRVTLIEITKMTRTETSEFPEIVFRSQNPTRWTPDIHDSLQFYMFYKFHGLLLSGTWMT